MADYGTNLIEVYGANALKVFYDTSIQPMITNEEYEGQVKDKSSKLNILTLASQGLQDYTGATLTVNNPDESEATLTTDQQKAYYFTIKDTDKFKSYVKNPESTLVQQQAGLIAEAVDTYILGFHADVAAGNAIGTDYTTGTVTVDVTTGAVTGSGTTFTAAMVGKGFKAAGHTKWYRVKTYSSGTSIVIEDDKDDVTSAYTGGAIGSGATYTIQAVTKVTVDKTTIYDHVLRLDQMLNEAKAPASDRFIVINPALKRIMLQADIIVRDVESDNDKVNKAYIGMLGGFRVFVSNQLAGNNTTGYYALAGHKIAIVSAFGLVKNQVENDLIGNFGQAFKGLYVYGAKVPDERRKFIAKLFFTV